MYFTDLEDLLTFFRYLRCSEHALLEARKEGFRGKDILHAIFNGEILEHYLSRKRVLVVGPSVNSDLQIHVVCDYADMDEIVAVTVYVPDRPGWVNEVVRTPHPVPAQVSSEGA